VSKATKRHCAGTKQVGFEPRPEDSYGRCGILTRSAGRLYQTRAVATEKARSPTADTRQSGVADNQ